MLGIALLIGLATAFNFIILKYKYSDGRYGDMALDVISLVILSALFGNTILGMLIAMVSSTIISLYLLVFPPGGYGSV
jgi:hypothetical protein